LIKKISCDHRPRTRMIWFIERLSASDSYSANRLTAITNAKVKK